MQTLPFPLQQRRGQAWFSRALTALVLGGLCSLLLASAATATNFSWSGEGSASANTWSNAANWTGGVAPAPSSSIGVLAFPVLNRSTCLQAKPSQTCYASFNDLTGLSVNQLQIEDSHGYSIGGPFGGNDGFTLGSGGLTINASEGSQGRLSLTTPIALGSSQTWSITGPPTPPAWPPQSIVFGNALSGENADLTINLNSITFLVLGLAIPGAPSIDDELGNLTINGTEAAIGESVGKYKSWVSLAPNATLNASDGHSLTLHDLEFESSLATGPITAVDSDLTLSGSSSGTVTATHSHLAPNGLLDLPSLSLDATSVLESGIRVQGNQPGTDYSEITSAGTVALGGATLALESLSGRSGPVYHEEGCPPPPVGQVYTLISTTGSLTGTFSNAPNGSTVVAYCPPSVVEGTPVAYFYRIDYHTTSSPETVTATALPAIPTAYTIEPQLPAISGSAIEGQTFSESHGSWTNSPTSYAYQWQDCDSSGNNCSNISGATGQTYTLTTTDVGHTIRVQEKASNAEGTGTPAVSAQTTIVQAAPPSSGQNKGGSTGGSQGGGTGSISAEQVKASLAQQLVPSGKGVKIAALLKSGGYMLPFTALEAGTVVVQWYLVPHGAKLAKRVKSRSKAKPILVASGKLTFSGAGHEQINVRLTAVGKRLLRHAKRLKLVAKGTFTPNSATLVTLTSAFSVSR
jgi:hypothetical protein